MSLSGMRVFNAAVSQYQTHKANAEKIKASRFKNNHAQESYDLKKKKALLDIEAKKHSGEMDELQGKVYKEQVDDYFKQRKKVTEGKTAEQDMADITAREGMAVSSKNAQAILAQSPEVQQSLMSVVQEFGAINQPQQGSGVASEVMADQGQLVPTNQGKSFKTQYPKKTKLKEKESYVIHQEAVKMMKATDLSNLETQDMNYREKLDYYTKIAEEMLTGRKPKEIKLPKNIKTRRQAIDYLMESNGMGREEAVNWLQNN